MKSIKYFLGLILISSPGFAGNDSTIPGSAITAGDLISRIPADSLLKDLDGRTFIPLTAENIRRLNIRASVDGKITLTLDSGEKFLLERDMAAKKLVDFKKAAEVIDRAELQMEIGR